MTSPEPAKTGEAAQGGWWQRTVFTCPTPNLNGGCETGPCTCPPHSDQADNACGEDEAAGCHFCLHYDCEAPCPNSHSEDDLP